MTRYTADFRISLTVAFEDDRENAIIDQAFETVVERLASVSSEADVEGIELVGGVRTARSATGGDHD